MVTGVVSGGSVLVQSCVERDGGETVVLRK